MVFLRSVDGWRPRVCNELSDAIYRILGTDKLKTTGRKPSTNGAVEKLHRWLNSLLAKTVQKHHSNWSDLFSYVTLMHGREARWTVDVLLPAAKGEVTTLPRYAAEMCQNMTAAYDLARTALQKQGNYMRKWYDRTVKKTEFQIGDKVRVYNDSFKPGLCPKWSHFYKDAGVITRKINSVTYIVSCPDLA